MIEILTNHIWTLVGCIVGAQVTFWVGYWLGRRDYRQGRHGR